MASEARIVFPVCAVEKIYPPTYTTTRVKISWESVRSVLQALPPEKPAPMKCLTLKKKPDT
jgi:hypothetical protein